MYQCLVITRAQLVTVTVTYTVGLDMPHTEGIDNVVIFWDDDDGEYNAGQLLTGRIEVTTHLK